MIAALALGALLAVEPPAPRWDFGASLAAYLIQSQPDYLQPTVTASRAWLHLEARYDYEDLHTGSVFVGGRHQLDLGERATLELVPLTGAVFGHTSGVAPALELTLTWRMLELLSQGEYVIDFGDFSESFLYVWSELSLRPYAPVRAGVALQRTKRVHVPLVVTVGPFVGVTLWKIDATAYWFDPLTHHQLVVLAVAVSW